MYWRAASLSTVDRDASLNTLDYVLEGCISIQDYCSGGIFSSSLDYYIVCCRTSSFASHS